NSRQRNKAGGSNSSSSRLGGDNSNSRQHNKAGARRNPTRRLAGGVAHPLCQIRTRRRHGASQESNPLAGDKLRSNHQRSRAGVPLPQKRHKPRVAHASTPASPI